MATKVRTYRIDVNSANVWDAIVVWENWAMTAQHLWTAASKDAWISAGNVPVLNNEWKLPDSTISDDAMKKSIYDPNGKQGNVYDYRNFDNTPDIPEVYDPVITFTQWWVSKGSITLNQAGTATIALDAWWVTSWEAIDITNNVVNAKYDNDTIKLNNNNKLYVDVDDELSSTSKLPVQNKVVQSAISWLNTDIGNVDAKFADYTPTASLSAVALSNDYDDLDDKPYIPDVIDALDSTSTNKALSANQGKVLKWMIDDIAAIGNFLSIWNSTTWQPVSFPKTTPYTYHTWDYYLVWTVWDTNYKPAWASYDWTASSTVESWEVAVWDMYVYDGTVWILQMNHGKAVSFANLTWDPYDNTALAIALNAKADASSLATVATSGSYTDLENKPTIPVVNDSTITIQKNSTTVDTFTLNQSSAKTIDISVPTTVAELTDASDYATVASLWAVATSNSYTDLDNKPSIPPFLSAGNGVDITNNYINVDVDNSTIKIDSNTNKLYYNNSAGYITKDVNDLTNYTKTSSLATVATSWAYSDLSWAPSLAAVATSWDYTDLTNTPSLATVATSGDYTDLSNTPSLATVATSWDYDDLNNKPTIPTDTSDLTNNAWFITDSDINTKMFELSSTSDLTTANSILAYVNDGKNPVVKYNNALYILHSKSASQLSFRSGMTIVAGTSDTNISQYTIVFNISNSAVATISATTSSLGKYLETDRNYSAPLTPQYNWSPATKKYVDDVAASINSAEWWNITGTLSDQTDLATALGGKQDNLTAQTAYTSKGSATKVPQITTNTLGQVTGITEVTITQPTKTSDLQNDSGFITNAVDNLTNYYKKTETYTQAEVNSLVQNFQWFEVVATLPTTDIKTNVIYLLWPTGSGADKYEEYIYSNSTWIKIWDTSVDLTNYFNKATQTSDAITEGSSNLFVTSSEKSAWSGKQDALSTQTAYTAKGSATKVPQITTNTLWQVTGITEVTITQPDISGKADKTEVLTKTNTTSFTPTWDYHPATKKYVDDSISQAWGWDMMASVYDPNNKAADAFDYTNFINTPTIPTKVSDLQNDAWYTTNIGTITSVKMNGATVSSSWEADLGTVITSHQDISGKQDKATSGSTSPAITPTYIWQQYVDTANDKLYVATWTSSSSDWMEVWAWWWGWTWDMAYADFEWETKTWASVTLDLTSTITPSANFTVNKPSTIKEWQIYILRVTSWSTVYTMSLGEGINNPWNLDLSLNTNETAQFVFLAINSSALELQKPGWWDLEYVTELEYEWLPSSKLTNWVSYFIYG